MLTRWLAAGSGIIFVGMLAAIVTLTFQRNSARDAAALAEVKLEAETRALADEKLSTAAALDAERRCESDKASSAARCDSTIAGLNADLDAARAAMSKCTDPKVVIDRLGRLFP